MAQSKRRIERLGLVANPTGAPWHLSHCQAPFAQALAGGRSRVHFAGRDERNRSRGNWVEIRLGDSGIEPVRFAPRPSLDLGRLGAFDDAGAMPSSLVEVGGQLLLYYTGWTLGGTVPFHFHIGLAASSDGGETFERLSEAPVLGRNRHDPFLTASAWVLAENGAFRMWYVSATAWVAEPPGPPRHYYTIKHATSADGIIWETDDRLCLPYREGEHAVARPVVRRVDGGYRMIFCARRHGETYRVYAAASADGLAWQRDQEPLLDVASTGWDSEMVCYASEVTLGNRHFLLYNGNAYGRDGFGAAALSAPL
jgi:hypothetical protein